MIHGKLNFQLNNLADFDIAEVIYFSRLYRNDVGVRAAVEEQIKKLEEIEDQRLIEILDKSTKNLVKVAKYNSIWLYPFLHPAMYLLSKYESFQIYSRRLNALGSIRHINIDISEHNIMPDLN